MSSPTFSDNGPESQRLLVERVRKALGPLLIGVLLFALRDAWLEGATPSLTLIKLVELATIFAVLRALQSPKLAPHAAWIAMAGSALFCVTTAAAGAVQHDAATTPLLLVVLAMGAGTLLPWGLGPQLAMVSVATLAFLGNLYAVQGSLGAAGSYP